MTGATNMKKLLSLLLSIGLAGCVGPVNEKQEPANPPPSQQEQLEAQKRSPEKNGALDQLDGTIEETEGLRDTDARKKEVEDKAAQIPVVPKNRRIIGGAQTVNCPTISAELRR